MLRKISVIGDYKNVANVDVVFENNVTVICGREFSGKTAIMEVVPFVFCCDQSLSDQEAFLFNGGVSSIEPTSISKIGSFDLQLTFDEVMISNKFSHTGGYFGIWERNGCDPEKSSLKRYVRALKLYGFKGSSQKQFGESALVPVKPSGEGVASHLVHLASKDAKSVDLIATELLKLFPSLGGFVLYSSTGEYGSRKLSFHGGECDVKLDMSDMQIVFWFKTGAQLYLGQLPMSIQAALAALLVASSEYCSDLIMIDDFDSYLSEATTVALTSSLTSLIAKSGKQLIVSSEKKTYLFEGLAGVGIVDIEAL